MKKFFLAVALGIVFGIADVAMTLQGGHTNVWSPMLSQAFLSRFAIGFLVPYLRLTTNAITGGAIAGFLMSLPGAAVIGSYLGILGSGIVFGALAGWAARRWAS